MQPEYTLALIDKGMVKCGCCLMVGKNITGCSCRGGKSHPCQLRLGMQPSTCTMSTMDPPTSLSTSNSPMSTMVPPTSLSTSLASISTAQDLPNLAP